MLKYSKIILSKVSFDGRLFEKELLKAFKYLLPLEVEDLKDWCVNNFKSRHMKILMKHALVTA